MRRSLLAACAVMVILVAGAAAIARLLPLPSWLAAGPPASRILTDREGGSLFIAPGTSIPIRLDAIDPLLVRATLAAEDRRFFRHPGIDPLALARAAGISLRRGRPLGGASTITMQTVRLARGRPSGFVSRIEEIGWSLVLEAHRSKGEILEAFLNRAPYGGGTIGVAAASQRWFGKSPAVLSAAEAALLAAVPRAPTRLNPARNPDEARAARNEVLARMARRGWISSQDAAAAAVAPLDLAPPAAPPRAPHFCDWVMESAPAVTGEGRVVTTLDPAVQAIAESALRDRIAKLGTRRIGGGAVVVLDSHDASILALVGSPDYGSRDAGEFDAALARRQPGSAVKPFTYAIAFASGLRPSSILADVPVSYEGTDGVFSPRNYAGTFAGPVPARLALANSWNVPAVEVLRRVRLEEVARGFTRVGLLDSDPRRLGLGLTLGAGEVSLLDLAAAYATLARGGRYIAPHAIAGMNGVESHAALDPISCAWVNEILSDPAARAASFGRGGPLEMSGIAAKTGTSSDWRDAWAILYSSRATVAVWMGNPDGAGTDRVTGVEGPAFVARAIIERIATDPIASPFPVPEGIEKRAVCPLSGCAADDDCPQVDWESFRVDDPPLAQCQVHIVRTIDTATGLLARPCTPVARQRRVAFVQLPDRFALWQADHGHPLPPTGTTECLCGRADCSPLDSPSPAHGVATAEVVIIRPIDGTVIACDPTIPETQQALALEATAPPGAEITWRVDGSLQGRTRDGGRLFWHPTPGEHRITASLDRGKKPIAVSVVQVE